MPRPAVAAIRGDNFEDKTNVGETALVCRVAGLITVNDAGVAPAVNAQTIGSTVYSGGVGQAALRVEAVKLGDQIITATFTDGDAAPATYSVHLTAAGGDLLIDATNSTQPGGTTTPTPTPTPSSSDPELPTDTAVLEAVKDQSPGKIVVVNTGDKNGNGVPDFADGYGLDLSGVSGVTETLPDDTSNPCLAHRNLWRKAA